MIEIAPVLDSDQQRLHDECVYGKQNLFFTGPAGSGKSLLLKAIIKGLKDKHGQESVFVTATTGLAATQIGGSTLHSFAGIGLGKGTTGDLIARVKKNMMCRKRWIDCHSLIIDEISMLEATLFEKLEMIARAVRGRDEVFGGINLIVTGDFYQLPPIGDEQEDARYAFEAECWNKVFPKSSQQALTIIHRQQDPEFIEILSNLRHGIATGDMTNKFKSLDKRIEYPDGLEATELFPTRAQVQAANISRLNALTSPLYTFAAIDHCISRGQFHLEKLQRDCIAGTTIELKVGAQVMLLKNLSDKLVNGSLGIVKEFILCGGEIVPLVEFSIYGPHGIDPSASITIPVQRQTWDIEEGKVLMASRKQIPLSLAYALSIHKSQGATLPRLRVDLGRVFERGQIYVAISRAQSMERLEIYHFDERKIMVDDKVIGYMKKLEKK